MLRTLIVAAMLAAFLPPAAEAKRRFGGSSRAVVSEPAAASRPGFATGVAAGVMVAPRPARGGWRAQPVSHVQEDGRVPFPPATNLAEPAGLRLSPAQPRKPWCEGETVVGGFCVVN